MEETIYLACEPVINSTARKFCDDFPHLDYDEVRGEATIYALKAIRSYNPNRGTKIETWIVTVVLRGLIDKTKRGFHSNLTKSAFPVTEIEPHYRSPFNLRLLMSEVSRDASKAIHLAVSESLGKCVLKQVLADLGWTQKRIAKAFQEVSEAL